MQKERKKPTEICETKRNRKIFGMDQINMFVEFADDGGNLKLRRSRVSSVDIKGNRNYIPLFFIAMIRKLTIYRNSSPSYISLRSIQKARSFGGREGICQKRTIGIKLSILFIQKAKGVTR